MLEGGPGNDTLLGGAGADFLKGGGGNDSIDGGVITDRIYYTDGNTVTFEDATGGVTINLTGITGTGTTGTGTASGAGIGTDTLANFNFFRASNYNDTITGSAALTLEVFEGGAGNDSIDGGAITDTLDTKNSNRVSYQNSTAAVNVNLATNSATGTATGNDTLANINQVRGSNYNDTLTGSNRTDLTEQFEGRLGDDSINGADGFDIARYDNAGAAVNVNLATGSATGGDGNDTLSGIEGILGSRFADTLTGGNAASATLEIFEGMAGNDIIDGGAGFDRVDYVRSTAGVSVTLDGAVNGTANDGFGTTDTLTSIEGVRGSAFNDTLTGSAAANTLDGQGGNDTLDGGAGLDTAVFSGIKAGYTLTRTSSGMTAVSASEGTDALIHIERLQFTDKTLAFDLDGNAGQAYRLYQAAFDRVPDQGGLGYWINEIDRGTGLSQAATGFINSAEFKALYGNNPSNSEFVTLIYDNVLHRAPDAGGYSYWMDQLSRGMTRENVLIGFSESTENKVALMAFDMDGNMGKDYRLYQAAFDRKPDVSGLDYWYQQMNSGVTLEQVASGFINSAEFKALYGNNPSNAELVTLLYDNVLHRAPDTGGFNYWMNELDHGTSREQVLIGFSESIENQLSLVGIVQTGIEFV